MKLRACEKFDEDRFIYFNKLLNNHFVSIDQNTVTKAVTSRYKIQENILRNVKISNRMKRMQQINFFMPVFLLLNIRYIIYVNRNRIIFKHLAAN